jgi:hypothetical protein
LPITPTRSLGIANATAFEPAGRALGLLLPAAAALILASPWPAISAEPAKAFIYRCEVDGKKITRDRPIDECRNKPQQLLNADGSFNREIAPTLTIEEREKQELVDRDREIKEARLKQEARVDRNLMQLYPNEATHRKARDKALIELQTSVKRLEDRIADLRKERVPLDLERQFYEPVGKPLPSALKSKIDANEASLSAQQELVQGQKGEVVRINATYDIELARLRKLWNGAQPGSLGPLPGPQQAEIAPAVAPAIVAKTPAIASKTTVK